ncbi:murein biosynthesis integral membrane protein MurJ [Polycladidibacter stylochi]|uniref:murein biosynthesis integral membrane protein MurJ n=1 Tax=Polycladidibacter stylochi TaxID=1807766 RepID=UPI000A4BA036|nr:murein biosynthesis integral membrane protein MurJ [Pseudovibrio stylochi]
MSKLIKNFAKVGSATLLSRLLGFIRDVMLAATVGTGPVADAFVVAFRLPNLFRRLFAEGAFNSAFVPLFARKLEEEGQRGARQFAGEVGAGLLSVLLLITALAQIAMPLLVLVLAPGYSSEADKFALTTLMARITFPYLIFMSLLAFVSGILNSLGRFFMAALAPVMLNVVMICVFVIVWALGDLSDRSTGILLAWGVAVAGVVQLLLVLVDLRRVGFSVPVLRPRFTKGVKRLLVLGVPGILAGGITQINVTVGTIIASLQESANSYLYYADRVYQLPLGVVGIAIGVVLLPSLTQQLRAGEHKAALHAQNRSMEFALALTLPATLALLIIPDAIVAVLFQRGAFSAEAVAQTAAALRAFAFGLPAFVLIKMLSPGYFAREDTKTPMHFAAASMVVNVGLSLALFPLLSHVGIAVATAAAGWVNAALLGVSLWRRGHFQLDAALMRRVPLLLLASVLMGGVVYLLEGALATYLWQGVFAVRFAALMALVLVGVASFALFVQLSGAVDLLGHTKRIVRR